MLELEVVTKSTANTPINFSSSHGTGQTGRKHDQSSCVTRRGVSTMLGVGKRGSKACEMGRSIRMGGN